MFDLIMRMLNITEKYDGVFFFRVFFFGLLYVNRMLVRKLDLSLINRPKSGDEQQRKR